MARILITHGVPAEGFALLRAHEVVIPPPGEAYSEAQMIQLLLACDAVLACGQFSQACVMAGTKLRVIVCYGAGYDAIDVSAARERGIPVVSIPDTVTEATAELTIGLMLAVSRRICELDRLLHKGENAFGMGKRMGVLLQGKTLGIIGMGRIGSRVAEIGRCLGMRIIANNRHTRSGAEFVSLEAILRQADVVSLHCPCTPENQGMLSRERLAMMQPSAFLINTARGKLVDEAALIDALSNGNLAGAGLDVFSDEPNIPQALRMLPNVVLTPHSGSNTQQTRFQMAEEASRQILDALANRPLQNRVV